MTDESVYRCSDCRNRLEFSEVYKDYIHLDGTLRCLDGVVQVWPVAHSTEYVGKHRKSVFATGGVVEGHRPSEDKVPPFISCCGYGYIITAKQIRNMRPEFDKLLREINDGEH